MLRATAWIFAAALVPSGVACYSVSDGPVSGAADAGTASQADTGGAVGADGGSPDASGSDAGAACPGAQIDCGAGCTDLAADPANCGTCGRVCAAGGACENADCRWPPVTPSSKSLYVAATGTIWGIDVAYDERTDRYLVAFFNDNAIRGIFLDRDGDPIPDRPPFVITPETREYGFDRVVSDGQGTFFALASVFQVDPYERLVFQIEAEPDRWKANAGVSPPITVALTKRGDRGAIRWNPVTKTLQAAWTDVSEKRTPDASGAIATYVNQVDPAAGTVTERALAADTEYCGVDRNGYDNFRGFGSPAIAVAPDGSALVVGGQDPTNEVCGPLGGGIWYRSLDPSGAPRSATGTLMRETVQGLQMESRVVWVESLQGYLAAWNNGTEGQGIWAERFDAQGATLDKAYSVVAANLQNANVGDDRIGQLAMAHDPISDTFQMMARGQDPGNGIAPLFEWRTDAVGVVVGTAPNVFVPEVYVPGPEIAADGKGHYLAIFRKSWGELWVTVGNY